MSLVCFPSNAGSSSLYRFTNSPRVNIVTNQQSISQYSIPIEILRATQQHGNKRIITPHFCFLIIIVRISYVTRNQWHIIRFVSNIIMLYTCLQLKKIIELIPLNFVWLSTKWKGTSLVSKSVSAAYTNITYI